MTYIWHSWLGISVPAGALVFHISCTCPPILGVFYSDVQNLRILVFGLYFAPFSFHWIILICCFCSCFVYGQMQPCSQSCWNQAGIGSCGEHYNLKLITVQQKVHCELFSLIHQIYGLVFCTYTVHTQECCIPDGSFFYQWMGKIAPFCNFDYMSMTFSSLHRTLLHKVQFFNSQ